MTKRGRILRDPRVGPGLLMIEGRQYGFCLEGVWKSDLLPRPGLVVDVKLDRAGRIVEITAVSDLQPGEEPAGGSLHKAKTVGVEILRRIATQCGMAGRWRR
jgi:hypothetical protein